MSTTTCHDQPNESPIVFALVSAMLFWGMSWISGKIIAEVAPAQVTVFYRLFLAAISMLPIMWVMQKFNLLNLRFNKRALAWSLPAGFFLAFYNQLFFLGLADGLPGKGGMLVTTSNPVFTFILSAILLGQAINRRQGVGLAMGLGGGLMMIEVWHFDLDQILAAGNLYFILASLTWAFLTLISQRGTRYADFITFSTLMYFWASLLSYAFAYQHDPFIGAAKFPAYYWHHLLFLSIVVVSIATSVFFLATQKLGPNRSSSFVFVVPVTAMGLSAWYFGERLSVGVAVGGACALCAVYLLNKKASS
ncbi:EamA/RhaT family transporter [Pseudoalteromonas rubra]|uniref:EamA/RhaT family transporter n=1 Tax=Pseudoalteromonas rubra TaxID=43658 RepID=A0A5S3WL65_9GAMM|nr:DMT family transporter [Pseudoalteromonas rubra]TMP27490.1 EamA/RhaT family transporter [Pseudoalteromonas rubra]TMP28990.1 EamA/RhaT family transporter [Pseudoalteromonas rubra]